MGNCTNPPPPPPLQKKNEQGLLSGKKTRVKLLRRKKIKQASKPPLHLLYLNDSCPCLFSILQLVKYLPFYTTLQIASDRSSFLKVTRSELCKSTVRSTRSGWSSGRHQTKALLWPSMLGVGRGTNTSTRHLIQQRGIHQDTPAKHLLAL